MQLKRLVTDRFRNLEAMDLSIQAPFVVFHGANAQGKTNALEAIHFLATLKPLRGRRVRELIRWGASEARLAAWVEHQGVVRHYRVDLGAQGRSAALDGERVELQRYFAGVRAITFTPADAEVISGSPGRRRDWLDRAAFTARPAHLDRVRRYRRALDQKAAALRRGEAEPAWLEVVDEQLARLGAELVCQRVRMLRELAPHICDLYQRVAESEVQLDLSYVTRAKGESVEERTEALLERLHSVRGRERDRGTTLAGPQLDEVRVQLAGRAARTFGSRGQVRSLVLSMKLAELLAARARGEIPLFLIDDVSSELDRARTDRLVGLLGELGAQVFATTTAPDHMSALSRDQTQYVRVEAGRLVG